MKVGVEIEVTRRWPGGHRAIACLRGGRRASPEGGRERCGEGIGATPTDATVDALSGLVQGLRMRVWSGRR